MNCDYSSNASPTMSNHLIDLNINICSFNSSVKSSSFQHRFVHVHCINKNRMVVELNYLSSLEVYVNDRVLRVANPDPKESLISLLRRHGLTGTKLGCAEGS